MPRSSKSSSTSRYESEKRRYQPTAMRINRGSNCRHLNSTGRDLVTSPPYQHWIHQSCNTAVTGGHALFYMNSGWEENTSNNGAFLAFGTPSSTSALTNLDLGA